MTTKRLAHTGIEYARGPDGRPGYGWNFYPGCLHKQQGICPVTACWAEGMSKRQRQDFHNPQLKPELLLAPLSIRKPSRILVNFMGDLGGDWVDPNMAVAPDYESGYLGSSLKETVFKVIRARPEHTFLFLTKNPQAWQRWKQWPDNAWVGATVCNQEMLIDALQSLHAMHARHKWLSIEPLFEALNGGECEGKRLDGLKGAGIDWIVIGGQTRPNVMPEIEWVKEIVEAADQAGVKVWLKDNLWGMLTDNDFTPAGSKDHDLYFAEMTQLRQERPIPRLTAADVQEVKA